MKTCNAPSPCYCENLIWGQTTNNCNYIGLCVYQRPLDYINYTICGDCTCSEKGKTAAIITCPIHG